MTYFFFFKPKRSKPLKVICRAITTAFHTCSFLQPGRPGHAEQRPAPCTLLTQVCSTPAAIWLSLSKAPGILLLVHRFIPGLWCTLRSVTSVFKFLFYMSSQLLQIHLEASPRNQLNLTKPISRHSFSFPVKISYPIKSPYIYIHTHTENPKSQNVS